MNQRDRIIIAVLLPIALIALTLAIVKGREFYSDIEAERQEEEQRKRNLAAKKRSLAEAGPKRGGKEKKEPEKPKKPGETDEPTTGEFKLLRSRAIENLTADERDRVIENIRAVFADDNACAAEKSNAYNTLINFRADAPAIIAKWLKTGDDPLVTYLALKACVELKGLYGIDGPTPEGSFAGLALDCREKADRTTMYQIAALLGHYREPRARKALVEMLASRDVFLVSVATRSLGRCGTRNEVPRLIPLLQSTDASAKAAACRAMDALLSYNAGREIILLADYGESLDKKAREWLDWWKDHEHEFQSDKP